MESGGREGGARARRKEWRAGDGKRGERENEREREREGVVEGEGMCERGR